jgi:hypothetical protein
MKPYLLLLTLLLCTAALADDKPLATQLGEAMAPYTRKAVEAYSQTILQFMAGGAGPLADGARSSLKMREQQQRKANPQPLRSVKECMKPGNVIDGDVQECVKGYREKTW